VTSTPYDELDSDCQTAVDELEDRRPQTEVVAVHGDWAYVSVGYVAVGRITEVLDPEEALGIIRIPTDFPNGARPYGLITVPALERTDNQAIRKQSQGDQKAEPVEQALDVDDVGFWSWKWDDVSYDDPSDLRKAPDLFRERLRMEG
jgi:hypothetical protein